MHARFLHFRFPRTTQLFTFFKLHENVNTVESRFLEPPRETKIDSRNREFRKIESKITEKFISGKRHYPLCSVEKKIRCLYFIGDLLLFECRSKTVLKDLQAHITYHSFLRMPHMCLIFPGSSINHDNTRTLEQNFSNSVIILQVWVKFKRDKALLKGDLSGMFQHLFEQPKYACVTGNPKIMAHFYLKSLYLYTETFQVASVRLQKNR